MPGGVPPVGPRARECGLVAAHSDAGLLWRLRHEIDLQANSDYWTALEGWLTPLEPESGLESPLGVTRSLADFVA